MKTTHSEQTVTVFVGCKAAQADEHVVLPPVDDVDGDQALLVIYELTAGDAAEKVPAVAEFNGKWNSREANAKPVAVRVKIAE